MTNELRLPNVDDGEWFVEQCGVWVGKGMGEHNDGLTII